MKIAAGKPFAVMIVCIVFLLGCSTNPRSKDGLERRDGRVEDRTELHVERQAIPQSGIRGDEHPFFLAVRFAFFYDLDSQAAELGPEDVFEAAHTDVDLTAALVYYLGSTYRDPAVVQAFLDAGVDPNSTFRGAFPLDIAVLPGPADHQEMDLGIDSSAACVRILLDAGANPRLHSSHPAFVTASAFHDVSVLQMLIQAGADPLIVAEGGRTALHSAAASNSLDVIHFLLERGLSIDAVTEEGTTIADLGFRNADPAVRDFFFHNVSAMPENLVYVGAGFYSVRELRECVSKGVDPAWSTEQGVNALYQGAANPDPEVFTFLRGLGLGFSEVNYGSRYNPLFLAIRRNPNPEVLRLVAQAITEDLDIDDVYNRRYESFREETSLLVEAARFGTGEVVRFLIEQGAHLDSTDPWERIPIEIAAEFQKDSEVLPALLDGGASLDYHNKKGENLLFAAAKGGNTQGLELLLDLGLEIDERNVYGYTPLMYASSNNVPRTVQLLIERGADIEQANDLGGTALLYASGKGNPHSVRLLLEAGADPNYRPPVIAGQRAGGAWTALMRAVSVGNPLTVQVLVNGGADVDLPDRRSGRTPLEIARRQKDKRNAGLMIAFLKTLGAE